MRNLRGLEWVVMCRFGAVWGGDWHLWSKPGRGTGQGINWRGTRLGAHAGRTYKRFDAIDVAGPTRNKLEGHRPRCPFGSYVQTFHGCDVAGRDTGTEAGAPPGQKYKRFSLHSGRWTRSVVLSGYGPTIAGYQSKCHKAAQHAQQKRQHV